MRRSHPGLERAILRGLTWISFSSVELKMEISASIQVAQAAKGTGAVGGGRIAVEADDLFVRVEERARRGKVKCQ